MHGLLLNRNLSNISSWKALNFSSVWCPCTDLHPLDFLSLHWVASLGIWSSYVQMLGSPGHLHCHHVSVSGVELSLRNLIVHGCSYLCVPCVALEERLWLQQWHPLQDLTRLGYPCVGKWLWEGGFCTDLLNICWHTRRAPVQRSVQCSVWLQPSQRDTGTLLDAFAWSICMV